MGPLGRLLKNKRQPLGRLPKVLETKRQPLGRLPKVLENKKAAAGTAAENGAYRSRTGNLCLAKAALCQLS
jgi:hypothetical protein